MVTDLYSIPRTDAEWRTWSFAHRQSHLAIREAIRSNTGLNLPEYVLEPITGVDFQGFLQRNQQEHINMDGALSLPSVDLQDVDIKNQPQLVAWIYLHAQEHFDAEMALGISS
jgi:hypothetical protein